NVIYTIENTTITANQSFEDVSLFVDANGSSNAVYVGLNNIVMASAGAVNNEQGNIGTVTYTVVNLTTLKFLIEQGDDVSKVVPSLVTDMSDLFKNNSTFNQNISTWDVSNVTNMSGMFYGAVTGSATAFNQPIGDWDVSNVTNMSGMFYGATAFNQPIGDWDVSSVTDMSAMFLSSALISDVNAFNQPIGNWNVSNVTDMGNMFSYARNFNQNISTWDVSNVNNMSNMFGAARDFNQNISTWDVSSVTEMNGMFSGTDAFNQNLSSWSVDNVTNCVGFSQDATSWTLPQPNFTNCTP
ncbi:MAG: BspA family leucine-rich repeat surface protein, partial [Flavobacteriales bacterium]